MSRNGHFVESSGAAQKPAPSIQKLGERYADKADKAGAAQRPSSPPIPFSGVQEGTAASSFLPKEREEPLSGWTLVKGHGI